jgi:hypothetical protein
MFGGFVPILNCFLRAPLKANQALLTSVEPRRLFVGHLNISGRTDIQADSATVTFIVYPEFLVHLAN